MGSSAGFWPRSAPGGKSGAAGAEAAGGDNGSLTKKGEGGAGAGAGKKGGSWVGGGPKLGVFCGGKKGGGAPGMTSRSDGGGQKGPAVWRGGRGEQAARAPGAGKATAGRAPRRQKAKVGRIKLGVL